MISHRLRSRPGSARAPWHSLTWRSWCPAQAEEQLLWPIPSRIGAHLLDALAARVGEQPSSRSACPEQGADSPLGLKPRVPGRTAWASLARHTRRRYGIVLTTVDPASLTVGHPCVPGQRVRSLALRRVRRPVQSMASSDPGGRGVRCRWSAQVGFDVAGNGRVRSTPRGSRRAPAPGADRRPAPA